MKLDNVYYGFTKDGKYGLFLKKYKTIYTDLGDVSMTIYYDLEEKCELKCDVIDLDSLIPITNMVGYGYKMSKRKVKEIYKANMDILIDVKGAYYGDIIVKTSDSEKLVENNVLFARINDPLGRSLKLTTDGLYTKEEKVKSGICVKEVRPIKTDNFECVVEPKRKILELDYKKML